MLCCRNFLWVCILLSASLSVFSQSKKNLTKTEIDSLNELAFEVKRYDIKKALAYLSANEIGNYKEAEQLLTKTITTYNILNKTKEVIKAYNNMGMVELDLKEYD